MLNFNKSVLMHGIPIRVVQQKNGFISSKCYIIKRGLEIAGVNAYNLRSSHRGAPPPPPTKLCLEFTLHHQQAPMPFLTQNRLSICYFFLLNYTALCSLPLTLCCLCRTQSLVLDVCFMPTLALHAFLLSLL